MGKIMIIGLILGSIICAMLAYHNEDNDQPYYRAAYSLLILSFILVFFI